MICKKAKNRPKSELVSITYKFKMMNHLSFFISKQLCYLALPALHRAVDGAAGEARTHKLYSIVSIVCHLIDVVLRLCELFVCESYYVTLEGYSFERHA